MSLINLVATLKHMSGKHNQKLHGRKAVSDVIPIIKSPANVSDIFKQVVSNTEANNARFHELTGMRRGLPNNYRVPAVMDPNTGQLSFYGYSGSHEEMAGYALPGKSQYERNAWIDNQTRFDLNFDSNGNVTKIQMIQGAAGVPLTDRNFQDKSSKRMYKVLDKLVGDLQLPSNTPVELELESDKFPPDVIKTTAG